MADSSRAQIYYVKETNWGETPAGPLRALRFTGESLGFEISNTTSREVRSDRQVSDLVQTGAQASGGFDFEFSYGAYDELMAGALFSDWQDPIDFTETNVFGADVSNSFLTHMGFDFDAAGLRVGQWIHVEGFTANGGANNGYYRIVDHGFGSIKVSPAPAVDEPIGGTIRIKGRNLRNGTTRSSYTLEKEFADVGKFMSFAGMVPSRMSLSLSTGQILTGSFQFVGKSGTISDTSIGTGAPLFAETGQVLNSVGHVGEIREAGAVMPSGLVQSLNFSVDNGLRGIQAMGSLGNVDIGAGRCQVTGSVTVYFSDGALYQKYLDGSPTELSFTLSNGSVNRYHFTFPMVKFTRGTVVAGGADQDVVASFEFQALREYYSQSTILIDRT